MPLEGLLESPLEVAEGLGAGAVDGRVAVGRRLDRALSPGLNPWELELFSQDRRQLFEGNLDLQDVLPWLVAGSTALTLLHGNRRPLVTFPLPHPPHLLHPVSEPRQRNLRQRDRDEVLPLLPDDLAVGNVFLQVLLDPTPYDLLEPVGVGVDSVHHVSTS